MNLKEEMEANGFQKVKSIDLGSLHISVESAMEIAQSYAEEKCREQTCQTCKHWGAQGRVGLVQEDDKDRRTCMAYLFGDMDDPNFKRTPDWVVTHGSMGGAKGTLKTYKEYGCINHNPISEFDTLSTNGGDK